MSGQKKIGSKKNIGLNKFMVDKKSDQKFDTQLFLVKTSPPYYASVSAMTNKQLRNTFETLMKHFKTLVIHL